MEIATGVPVLQSAGDWRVVDAWDPNPMGKSSASQDGVYDGFEAYHLQQTSHFNTALPCSAS